ncbi:MAG: hypothetical protein HFG68_03345 [Hungatella sp.]|nr:hypothetical protein [Hungatella sp.]
MENILNYKYIEKFQDFKEKKFLIYGTGKIAKKLIVALQGFHIVGILDKVRFSGKIEGIPIIMWDEIYEGNVDIIIIASLERNYKEIYERIVDRCLAYDIKIFGANGQNLISYYSVNCPKIQDLYFFEKNEEKLLQLINNHDAISFDLFDTLIMRKNLEPADLFDIVEKRIQKKGISLENFKKIRREAELQAGGNNIYIIYDILRKMIGINEHEKDTILREEIKCEKEYIIPRKRMVNIMKKAYGLGKQVTIISNMYFPANILENILNEKGIVEYNQIFVSCEYGVSKSSGLFKEYLKNVKANSYLHIGDDEFEDIIAAEQCGIDSFGIKSAYEMLKISNLRKAIVGVHNTNEKGMLGLLISELFNDPFVLYKTNGVVKVSKLELLGKIIVAPIIVLYMLKLIDIINSNNEYQGILFGSRDGYLFKKIYDRLNHNGYLKNFRTPTWYFMASRKLCLKTIMMTGDSINILEDCYGEDSKKILAQIFNIPDSIYDKECSTIQDYCFLHTKEIIEKSNRSRRNYYKYIDKNKIARDNKYIYCDLISHGTIQYVLNKIFKQGIYGFYLCKIIGNAHFDSSFYSCLENINPAEWSEDDNSAKNFLEIVITSQQPSVEDMDKEGNPIFSMEHRTKEEIDDIQLIQQGIENFFFEYIDIMYIDGETIGNELPTILLKKYNEIYLEGECEQMRQRILVDDLDNNYYRIFKGIYM